VSGPSCAVAPSTQLQPEEPPVSPGPVPPALLFPPEADEPPEPPETPPEADEPPEPGDPPEADEPFGEWNANRIGSITASGVITEFPTGSKPWGMAVGSDGNIWVAEENVNKVARITP
jgi:hypothetical protein